MLALTGQPPDLPTTLRACPAQDPQRGGSSATPTPSALLAPSWPPNQSFWALGKPNLPSEMGIEASCSHFLSKSSTSAGSWNNQSVMIYREMIKKRRVGGCVGGWVAVAPVMGKASVCRSFCTFGEHKQNSKSIYYRMEMPLI